MHLFIYVALLIVGGVAAFKMGKHHGESNQRRTGIEWNLKRKKRK